MPAGAFRQHPAARRALLAEDQPDHRAWLGAVLRARGFDVAEAHDGRELLDALFMVPPRHFDIVVCDQMMPMFRGTECLARASARSSWIIVTASRDPAVELAAEQFGALGVLRKPFDAAALGALLDDPSKRPSATHQALRLATDDDE